MANYVHNDDLPQAFVNACLILIHLNAPCEPLLHGPPDQGNLYYFISPAFRGSLTQDGLATFGDQHILSLVAEVTTRALKAAWFQKWFVHTRLRPEEFGALIDRHLRTVSSYPINGEILGSAVLPHIFNATVANLLPQAYPEGSPLHPSYPSGHATIAGACVTILKAYFDESFIIQNPVIPDPADATHLVPYVGPPGEPPLTVGGELNKLASNIALGWNFAGLHYRSDYIEGLRLGEEVAIGILEEQKITYNENFSFTFTRFDDRAITI